MYNEWELLRLFWFSILFWGFLLCVVPIHPLLIQVLGKCAKPIPVLLLGVILGRRSYPLIKYLIVILIVVGVALFLYKDKGGRSEAEGQIKLFDIVGIGELLLVCVCVWVITTTRKTRHIVT